MKRLVVSDPFPLLSFAISQKICQTFSFPQVKHKKVSEPIDCGPDTLYVIDQHDPGLSQFLKESQGIANLSIIVTISRPDPCLLEEFLQYSLSGLILKTAPDQEWSRALSCLKNKTRFVSNEILDTIQAILLNRYRDSGSDANEITDRELQVLELIVEGLTTKEIAHRLGIGTPTVDTHRVKLMNKLGVNNCASLVREAFLNNMISKYHGKYGYTPHVFH